MSGDGALWRSDGTCVHGDDMRSEQHLPTRPVLRALCSYSKLHFVHNSLHACLLTALTLDPVHMLAAPGFCSRRPAGGPALHGDSSGSDLGTDLLSCLQEMKEKLSLIHI